MTTKMDMCRVSSLNEFLSGFLEEANLLPSDNRLLNYLEWRGLSLVALQNSQSWPYLWSGTDSSNKELATNPPGTNLEHD